MGLDLNPGFDAFKISAQSGIYIDKLNLITYTNKLLGQEKRFICVSRPRRFGKSMAANMLCAYYSRGCHSEKLFQNLEIFKNSFYKNHLNQYDVIFLNIQQFIRSLKLRKIL